ncbi:MULTISPECIES: histidinol-phosphatase HisJ [Bacillaceae]|uniref:histidinol-phosphatase HisJ n=1 Tax=Bacillaceae TaxID=186817 RepID=UPI000BEE7DFC|nr:MULTISPECIES: histidinol-phosphatase HisJ [unclassified Bacillus (in: firmicutes)]PEC47628.1 histidinol-phosphatase [Bacillus sp. AFS096315]PFM83119.1 histidinol-phosphatase [Bacillus sp. AFS077874]
MKIDGHTHTQYCPHGSGDDVQLMIEKAIELGFDEYHITEHTPVPSTFQNCLKPDEAVASLAMSENEVDEYINEMYKVRDKYKDRINIKIGFEYDYLPSESVWFKDFLKEYGKYCDTGLLSVHYLEGKNGWHCIDYKAEDTLSGLVNYYGSAEAFQLAYYDLVKQSIIDDLGPFKPKRIGHMTLCNKFKQFLKCDDTEKILNKQVELLKLVKEKNYILDYNTAGLFKEYCGETYPPNHVVEIANSLNIELMYGSDSHSIKDVGRGYEVYFSNSKKGN